VHIAAQRSRGGLVRSGRASEPVSTVSVGSSNGTRQSNMPTSNQPPEIVIALFWPVE